MTAGPRAKLFAALGAPAVDVRYVGGAVRNWRMNQIISDIDIATPEEPAQVMERLGRAGIKAIPTGIDHGTVTAVADGETAEITTLRRDTACNGRHAAVEFTTDWREDARRRDFTINAMSLRPDGTLFDDHGGQADAAAGRVRFVGDAGDRIQEDYLRILRLFRFFAWYGRTPIDDATLAAVRAHVGGLARLSVERVAQELAKLLAAPDPAPAVTLMIETRVMTEILPDARDIFSLRRLLPAEHAAGVPPDWRRRLAALLPTEHTAAARLKLSNADSLRLSQLTAAHPVMTPGVQLDRALYRLGRDIVMDRLLLAEAKGEADNWPAARTLTAAWMEKSLPVGGADVLALGIAPGPRVGELLRALEDWWIAADFTPSRSEALAELKRRAVG